MVLNDPIHFGFMFVKNVIMFLRMHKYKEILKKKSGAIFAEDAPDMQDVKAI